MSSKPIFVSRNKQFTPELRAFFLTLGDPKFYNETDKEGSYSVTLSMDPSNPDHQQWMSQMEDCGEQLYQEWCDAAGKKKVQRRDPIIPFKPEEDREGNETGNMLVKLNRKAKKVKGDRVWTYDVPVFDTQNNRVPIEKIRQLGRGSKMIASFDARAYYMSGIFGVSFGLRAVQLIEPVWREGDVGSDFAGSSSEGFVLNDAELSASDFGE